MRFEIVHVTNHAIARWKERTSYPNYTKEQIVDLVQQSRQLKKNEILPYPIARLANSIYTLYNNILFILEPVEVNEYRLVTVIADPPKQEKEPQEIAQQEKQAEVQLNGTPQEQRKSLKDQKIAIEKMLSYAKPYEKKFLRAELASLEEKIKKNKERCEQEPAIKSRVIVFGSKEWDKLVSRRIELLFKKDRCGLTSTESAEYCDLKKSCLDVLQIMYGVKQGIKYDEEIIQNKLKSKYASPTPTKEN